ncbi:hypothetical protein [Paraburkholderia sp. CI3]|uniref:hypothetical protein n=1 Tax=Paraburkholderia sp. CI3 TaxID=2991060 RepID=UPI003D255AAD
MATWLDKYFEGKEGTQTLFVTFSASLTGIKPPPVVGAYVIESFWTHVSLKRDDLVIPPSTVLQKRLSGVSPSVIFREGSNPARKIYGDQVAPYSPIHIVQTLGGGAGAYDLYMGEPESQTHFQNIDASEEGKIQSGFRFGWSFHLEILNFTPHPHPGGPVRTFEGTVSP